jgi:hypothetical protein
MAEPFYISYLNPRLYSGLDKGKSIYLIQSLQGRPMLDDIFLISMEKVGPDNYPPDMLIRECQYAIDLTTLVGSNTQVAYGFPEDGIIRLFTIQFKPPIRTVL